MAGPATPEETFAALRFLLAPAEYARSELPSLPEGLALPEPKTREEHWRRLRRTSSHLLDRLPPDRLNLRETIQSVDHFALLPRDEWLKIARFCGALLHVGEIGGAIGRTQIAALVEAIGAEARDFAIRQIPFFHAQLPKVRDGSLTERVLADGKACIAHHISELEPAIARRIRWRFHSEDEVDRSDAIDPETARAVLARVFKQGEREWRVLSG